MLAHVGERFLRHARQLEFRLVRELQPLPTGLQQCPDFRAGAPEPLHRARQRQRQPALVHRRAEVFDQFAQLPVRLLQSVLDLLQLLPGLLLVAALQGRIEQPHLHAHAGKGLRQRVVQLARQPVALLAGGVRAERLQLLLGAPRQGLDHLGQHVEVGSQFAAAGRRRHPCRQVATAHPPGPAPDRRERREPRPPQPSAARRRQQHAEHEPHSTRHQTGSSPGGT